VKSHLLLEHCLSNEEISEARALAAETERYCIIMSDDVPDILEGDGDDVVEEPDSFQNPMFKYCPYCEVPWPLNKMRCMSISKDYGCGSKLPSERDYKRQLLDRLATSSVFGSSRRKASNRATQSTCSCSDSVEELPVDEVVDDPPPLHHPTYKYEVLGVIGVNPNTKENILRVWDKTAEDCAVDGFVTYCLLYVV
jgi:hypothetical protein